MTKRIAALFGALALTALPLSAGAQESGVEIGWLDCVADANVGFIIGSTKEVRCTYTPADKSLAPETYGGTITKFGVDVGVTGATVMQWAVVATNKDIYAPGALAGTYAGVGAEATAVAGAGANVLVGGSDKSFSLQPVSVQQQAGLNFAVGVQSFELKKTAG